MLQDLFLFKVFSEGEQHCDTSSLFDLQQWFPIGGLGHDDTLAFKPLITFAEIDRCLQAQLMPVSSPRTAGCSVGGPGIPGRC